MSMNKCVCLCACVRAHYVHVVCMYACSKLCVVTVRIRRRVASSSSSSSSSGSSSSNSSSEGSPERSRRINSPIRVSPERRDYKVYVIML